MGYDFVNSGYWIWSVISFMIHIAIAYYLYDAARVRGMNPWLWGGFGFLFPVITIILFWLISWEGSRSWFTGPSAWQSSRRYDHKKSNKINSKELNSMFPPAKQFSDPQVDELIAEGKFDEARESVKKMLRIAQDVNNNVAVTAYWKYLTKINDAAKSESEEDWWSEIPEN